MYCNLTLLSKSLFQIYIHKIWGWVIFYRAGHFSITEILWKSDPGVIILYRIVTRGSLYPRVNILYDTGITKTLKKMPGQKSCFLVAVDDVKNMLVILSFQGNTPHVNGVNTLGRLAVY